MELEILVVSSSVVFFSRLGVFFLEELGAMYVGSGGEEGVILRALGEIFTT